MGPSYGTLVSVFRRMNGTPMPPARRSIMKSGWAGLAATDGIGGRPCRVPFDLLSDPLFLVPFASFFLYPNLPACLHFRLFPFLYPYLNCT
jgi:hypothetical protein